MAGENGIQVRVNGYGDVDRSRKGGTKEVKGTHARVMLSVVSSRRAVLVQGHGWWQWGARSAFWVALRRCSGGDKGIKEPLHEHIVSYMLVTCGRSLSRVPCRCTTGAHSGCSRERHPAELQSTRRDRGGAFKCARGRRVGGEARNKWRLREHQSSDKHRGLVVLVRDGAESTTAWRGLCIPPTQKNPACDLLGIGFEGAEGCELRQLDRPALMLIAACCSMLSYCRRAPTETHRLVKGSGRVVKVRIGSIGGAWSPSSQLGQCLGVASVHRAGCGSGESRQIPRVRDPALECVPVVCLGLWAGRAEKGAHPSIQSSCGLSTKQQRTAPTRASKLPQAPWRHS